MSQWINAEEHKSKCEEKTIDVVGNMSFYKIEPQLIEDMVDKHGKNFKN